MLLEFRSYPDTLGTPGEQVNLICDQIKPSSPKEESQSYLCPSSISHISVSMFLIHFIKSVVVVKKRNQEQKEFDAIGQSKPPQQLTCKTPDSKEPVRIVSTHGTTSPLVWSTPMAPSRPLHYSWSNIEIFNMWSYCLENTSLLSFLGLLVPHSSLLGAFPTSHIQASLLWASYKASSRVLRRQHLEFFCSVHLSTFSPNAHILF